MVADAASPDPLRLGRDSVFYRVGSRWPVIGLLAGVPALIRQVLHPAIGIAVHDHSTLKTRPVDRLRRTAQYVVGTAHADDATALALVERTSKRHVPVRGVDPLTGTPFSADDPELQVYVHVTEMAAFLDAYKFLGGTLSGEDEDHYWAELAPIGALLGAPVAEVPASAASASEFLATMEPQLRVTPEGRDLIDFLLAPRGTRLLTALRPVMPLNRRATAAMLPDSIREMAGLPASKRLDAAVRGILRAGVKMTGPLSTAITWKLVGAEGKASFDSTPERTVARGPALPAP